MYDLYSKYPYQVSILIQIISFFSYEYQLNHCVIFTCPLTFTAHSYPSTFAPKGIKDKRAILKNCFPNGIPTIVIHHIHPKTIFPRAIPHRNKSDAFLVIKQIQAIYHEEGKLNELSSEERLMQRQLVIKPLVDALFAYLKKMEPTVPTSGQLRKAYTYILNQEKYLRVFLKDGEVPIDNNASERAIRGFCIGKKNWQMIDTINGAHSSAIIYSIAETVKANNLKPYDYFVYLLEEIPKHMDQEDRTFLEDLLPWSEKLPEGIRKQQ